MTRRRAPGLPASGCAKRRPCSRDDPTHEEPAKNACRPRRPPLQGSARRSRGMVSESKMVIGMNHDFRTPIASLIRARGDTASWNVVCGNPGDHDHGRGTLPPARRGPRAARPGALYPQSQAWRSRQPPVSPIRPRAVVAADDGRRARKWPAVHRGKGARPPRGRAYRARASSARPRGVAIASPIRPPTIAATDDGLVWNSHAGIRARKCDARDGPRRAGGTGGAGAWKCARRGGGGGSRGSRWLRAIQAT